jgi:glycosyltransferase involved in cell wall biosynthesis
LIAGKVFNPEIKKLLVRTTLDDERIILTLKRITDDDIQIYMNASDIIVTPYKDVLTSGQVILAMSFHKPIIAPKIGCIIDTLDENGSFLYLPDKKNSLALALEKSLKNKNKLTEMGEYNLDKVRNYNWKKIVIETIKLYQKILRNNDE